MVIRTAAPADHPFVHDTAVDVFAAFGDYREVVPEWLRSEGVLAFIAEEEGERVGFVLVGFYRLDEDPGSYAADLLAIAVAPGWQGRGIGRQLLAHALTAARAARRRFAVREMRLSVAETNHWARGMFERAGFSLLPGDHGHYDGGQRALHLRRVL